MLQATCLKLQGTNDKHTLYKMWYMIYLWSFTLCPYISICMYVYMPRKLVHHIPTITLDNYWHVVHLLYNVYHYSYPILPHITGKHYSLYAGIPATQIHLLVHCLPRYLVHNSCIFFLSITCWRLTLICSPACNMLQDLLFILHLSFWDPHILFWTVPLP